MKTEVHAYFNMHAMMFERVEAVMNKLVPEMKSN